MVQGKQFECRGDLSLKRLRGTRSYTVTRDFLTTAFASPAVDRILMWGFDDGTHWLKSAPLFRADWTAKPALSKPGLRQVVDGKERRGTY
eukprot:m.473756 g.473756  ORF g.473756 m.473756 type:complete len:90 (-) comp34939_c0_seq1:188-457(-)